MVVAQSSLAGRRLILVLLPNARIIGADMKENASSSLDTEESWRGIQLARMLRQYQSPNGQNDYLPRNNAPKVQM
jgi:hypothetical protein